MIPVSKDLKASVQRLIDYALSTGEIKSTAKAILKKLEGSGFVYRLRCQPLMVIVHRMNRDRFGVGPHDVHKLVDVLTEIGWDPDEPDGIACEVEAEDIEFNIELVSSAHGLLGPVEGIERARLASLAASHTNYGLRVLLQGVQHAGNQRLCKDGKLSMAVAEEQSPDMANDAKQGLEWRVLRPEAIAEWPQLPDLLQQVGNTRPEVGEHELQIARRVHNIAVGQEQKLGAPDYDDLKRRALRSKPACAASLSLNRSCYRQGRT